MRKSDDRTLDFIKTQQATALVETIDMLVHYCHMRQSFRDYAHGFLAAASQERVAMQNDHFAVAPTTLGKVDEDRIAGIFIKHTALDWAPVSKCRAFDSKFPSKFLQLLMNAASSTKLQAECKSKPVLAITVESRVKEYDNVIIDLKMDDMNVMKSGRVNSGKIGIFRAKKEGGSPNWSTVSHLYTKETVDIHDEQITPDFELEGNIAPKTAVFKKGSRAHTVLTMFTQTQQSAMAPWSGKSEILNAMVLQAVKKIHDASSGVKVQEDHDKLMEAFVLKRTEALKAANDKLKLAKEEQVKRRRITVADI